MPIRLSFAEQARINRLEGELRAARAAWSLFRNETNRARLAAAQSALMRAHASNEKASFL